MREVFEQQYLEAEKSLYLVAIGYLHNTEDARDAVQEAAVAAFRSYGKLKQKEFFKTWMTRIVINKCKDYRKRQRATEELTDNANLFYDMPVSDFEMMDAICRLDPALSQYITLRFYHDMTYEEIAKLLKRPVSTVRYRTQQAMEQLKKILEGDGLS